MAINNASKYWCNNRVTLSLVCRSVAWLFLDVEGCMSIQEVMGHFPLFCTGMAQDPLQDMSPPSNPLGRSVVPQPSQHIVQHSEQEQEQACGMWLQQAQSCKPRLRKRVMPADLTMPLHAGVFVISRQCWMPTSHLWCSARIPLPTHDAP